MPGALLIAETGTQTLLTKLAYSLSADGFLWFLLARILRSLLLLFEVSLRWLASASKAPYRYCPTKQANLVVK